MQILTMKAGSRQIHSHEGISYRETSGEILLNTGGFGLIAEPLLRLRALGVGLMSAADTEQVRTMKPAASRRARA